MSEMAMAERLAAMAAAPTEASVEARMRAWGHGVEWARQASAGLDWASLDASLRGMDPVEQAPGGWLGLATERTEAAAHALIGSRWEPVARFALALEIRRGLAEAIERGAQERGARRRDLLDRGSGAGLDSDGRGRAEQRSAIGIEEREGLMASADRASMAMRLMEAAAVAWRGGEREADCPMLMALEGKQFVQPGRMGAWCSVGALRCLGSLADGAPASERMDMAWRWAQGCAAMLAPALAVGPESLDGSAPMAWLLASLGSASADAAQDAPLSTKLREAAGPVGAELSAWMMGVGAARMAVGSCVMQLVMRDVLCAPDERAPQEEWALALRMLLICSGPAARGALLGEWRAMGPEESCVAWSVCAPEERSRWREDFERVAGAEMASWARPFAEQIMADKAAREIGESIGPGGAGGKALRPPL